jgi:hypothetical protein
VPKSYVQPRRRATLPMEETPLPSEAWPASRWVRIYLPG